MVSFSALFVRIAETQRVSPIWGNARVTVRMTTAAARAMSARATMAARAAVAVTTAAFCACSSIAAARVLARARVRAAVTEAPRKSHLGRRFLPRKSRVATTAGAESDTVMSRF